MAEDGAFRTDDMALATVLAMAGYTYKLHAMTHSQALWIFSFPEEREEDVAELLDEYADFEYKVEPREFIRKFAEVRRELFALLPGNRKPRVSSPVASSPAQG